MIEMPPFPEPPELEPDKIRALIDYAEKVAAYYETEMKLTRELDRTTSDDDRSELITGWKFAAQGLRDSYDGGF